MKLAGQSPSSSVSSVPSSAHKDPVARKKEFLKRRRMQADSQDANKVIEASHYPMHILLIELQFCLFCEFCFA